MHMHDLNWLAVLVAAISTMVVGFLWYSPLLFAKPWMREMGYDPADKAKTDEMKKKAGPAYLGSMIAGLLTAFTLALFLDALHVQDLHHGLAVSPHRNSSFHGYEDCGGRSTRATGHRSAHL